MSPTEDFAQKFHSLEGTTLSERKKQFHLLLNSVQNPAEIDFASIKTQTPLEEVLFVEALVFFRRTSELLEVLQNEHTVLIQKVLNASSWFVAAAFGKLSAKDLVEGIFPNLSHNVKLKLLNKLAQYLEEGKCEEVFGAVNEKYGLFMATKLLHACSGSFVLKHLKRHKIELNPSQLLQVIKKNPQLKEEIFVVLDSYSYKLQVGEKYKKVFVYLAKHDGANFLKLNEKYAPDIKLGWKQSKNFLEKNLTMIDPKKVFKILRISSTSFYLEKDFLDFYAKILPKTLNDFKDNFCQYEKPLDHLSHREKKFEVLSTCFMEVYGNDMLEEEDLIDEQMLELVPIDRREIWMGTHSRPDSIDQNTWISLMRIEKSVPLLKEKFERTSYKERGDLIQPLLKTCKFNRNLDALLDLMKYFLANHKNLNGELWQTFLIELPNSFPLKTLNEEHWICLGKCLDFVVLDDKYINWDIRFTFEGYLEYCCRKGLPIEDVLVKLIRICYGSLWYLSPKSVEYEKHCLMILPSLASKLCKEQSEMKRFYIDYLQRLVSWNDKHKDDQISYFEHESYIEELKKFFLENEYVYEAECFLRKAIIHQFEKSQERGLFETFCTKRSQLSVSTMLIYLLHNHPAVLKDCIKPLTQQSGLNFALHFYKYFHHLDLPQTLSKKCLEIINGEEEDGDTRRVAASLLVHTMTFHDFENFISAHQPNDAVAKLESEQDKNVYKAQQGFLNCLHQINPPVLATEQILNFSQGDYFKLVNKSLFSTTQNLTEGNAQKFLQALKERPVSVKKHSIMLHSRIFDKKTVKANLAQLMAKEKNSTIRKCLLKASFNLFVKNPEDWTWNLVKDNVKAVAPNDVEALNILAQYERVSPDYFGDYFTFTWNVLESAKSEDSVTIIKSRFLASLTDKTIKMIPQELCYTILDRYLFKSKKFNKFEKQLHILASTYLIFHSSSSTTSDRVDQIIGLLKNCIETWNDADRVPLCRKFVHNFIKELCGHFLDKKCLDAEILKTFLAAWEGLLQPHEAFDQYLYLRLTSLYLECSKLKWSQVKLGEKLSKFLDNEPHLDMNTFCKTFEELKERFVSLYDDYDTNESYLSIAEGVLKSGNQFYSLVLVLLPNSSNTVVPLRVKQKLTRILNEFLSSQKDSLKIELFHYLNAKSYVEDTSWFL